MARQNLTKALALLLAVMMLIGLTACAKTPASSTTPTESKSEPTSSAEEKLYYNKTGYPICDTPITLRVAGPKPGSSSKTYDIGSQADKTKIDQLQYYYDHLGLDIIYDAYIGEDWQNQLTMLITTDNLPDMVWGSGLAISDVNKYGEQKYFANINNYSDLMPNFEAFVKEFSALKSYCTAADGGIYGLVAANPVTYGDYRCFLNRSFMENLKAEVPTTIDEFYKLLCRIRDEDANGNGDKTDEIPLDYTANVRQFVDRVLYAAYNIRSSDVVVPLHVGKDNKVTLLDDNYKAYLKFLCQLYDEGLMDKNSFVLSGEDSYKQVKDNLVGFYPAWAPFVSVGGTIEQDAEIAIGLNTLSSEYTDGKNLIVRASQVSGGSKFNIAEKSQYKEACARLLDFLYTEDGQASTRTGIIGDSVKKVKDDLLGVNVLQIDADKLPKEFSSTEEWRNSKLMLNEIIKMTTAQVPDSDVPNKADAILEAAKQKDPEKWPQILKREGWTALVAEDVVLTNAETVDAYPTMAYADSVADDRTRLYTDINTTITDAKSTIILGGLSNFDANWDKLVKDMESSGLKDLLKIEQDAYDAMKK